MTRQAVKKLDKPTEPPEGGQSELAAVLDRAAMIQESYGWLVGSLILFSAIGAVDKKRNVFRIGLAISAAVAALKLWWDR